MSDPVKSQVNRNGFDPALAGAPNQINTPKSSDESNEKIDDVEVQPPPPPPSNNAVPSNAVPSNVITSNAIPSNAVPSNAVPSNTVPSNIVAKSPPPPPPSKQKSRFLSKTSTTSTVSSSTSKKLSSFHRWSTANTNPKDYIVSLRQSVTSRSEASPKYVDRCSNVYVVASYLGSLAFAGISLGQALTETKYRTLHNIPYMAAPGTYLAMAIGALLQPKNESKKYKALLYSQMIVTFVLPDAIAIFSLRNGFDEDGGLQQRILIFLIRGSIGLVLCVIFLHCRAKAARLPEERLSRWLTDSVVIPSIQTLGVYIFFILDPIRCYLEHHRDLDVEESHCMRTLLGQSGLVFILLNYHIFSMLNSIFPPHIVQQKTINLYKIATGDINWREAIQLIGISIAICCSFFLFSQYNAWSPLPDSGFRLLLGYAILGAGTLFLISTINFFSMAKAERREAKGQTPVAEQDNSDRKVVLKLSRFHQSVALLATSSYTIYGTYITATLRTDLATLQGGLLPITLLLYVIGLFADPRSGSKRYEFILFLSFTLEELNQIIFAWITNAPWDIIQHAARAMLWSVFFKAGMKWRTKIVALSDAELTNFFLEAVLKNCVRNSVLILFVTFKALNCVSTTLDEQEGDFSNPITAAINECENSVLCSLFISIYLVGYIFTVMVFSTLSERQRKSNIISWENMVTMQGVNVRQITESILTCITICCGMFLFCMIETIQDNRNTLISVGLVGLFGSTLTFGSEVLMLVTTILQEEEMIRDARNSNSFMLNCYLGMMIPARKLASKWGWIVNEERESVEQIAVSEVANFWVFLSVVLTTSFMILNVTFALGAASLLLHNIMDLIIPIILLPYMLSILMKPKRTDKIYKRFLVLHFIQIGCISEILGAIGNITRGENIKAILNIARIPIFSVVFRIMLGLRASIAKLPPSDLSDFLVNVLLVNGAGSLTTIVFFLFETLSCWVEESEGASADSYIDRCGNTANAALWLSSFMIFAMMIASMSRAVPKVVRDSVAMTKERLVTLDVDNKELLQGILFLLVGIASLFLLSTLGVAEDPTSVNLYLGTIGLVAFTLIFTIEGIILLAQRDKYLTKEEESSTSSLDTPNMPSRRSKMNEMKMIQSSRRMGVNQFFDQTGVTGMA
ncbi:hypothetical protein TrST_g4611 [Triparma strigata]|uniref:Uncharacterized protein n=1 Tax=Triparma strigata TaxID=1606541 RepID=A0A9W6ZFQ9_9STRA|nr:hypothetical protein TrST_g4611 [Triparma strigata]